MRASDDPTLIQSDPTGWTRRGLLSASFAALLAGRARAQDAPRPVILVLSSDESERTLSIISTFKKRCEFAVRMSYLIGNEADAGVFIADNIRGQPLSLVFAIGTLATQIASREFAGTPVIYGEVPPEQAPAGSANALGVTTRLDPTATLQRMQQLLPGVRDVGMMLATGSESYAALATTAATSLGLKLAARHVGSPDEVNNAFIALSGTSQLVWLPQESRIWSASSLARVFHEATIQRFPLVSFLRSHLDAPNPPAMAAFAHPEGVGEMAAGLARTALLGEPAPNTSGVRPMLCGHARAMRAAGMVVSAKSTAALDELTGR